MIVRANITEQLVEDFMSHIGSGEWQVGEKIPSENQLAVTLGVSRASIRTAIQYLSGLGVLESRHGKGTFVLDDHANSQDRVTAEDCADIEDVLVFRRALESETAYLAAQNCSAELIDKLKINIAQMRELKGSREKFVRKDIEFHKLISRASGNIIMEKSLIKVFSETLKRHEQMNTLFGYDDGLEYHGRILRAIEKGDAGLAKHEMEEHMTHAIEKLKQ